MNMGRWESLVQKEGGNELSWECRAQMVVEVDGNMGSKEMSVLWELLWEFNEVFSELPGKARNCVCELRVKKHMPFMHRSY